MILSGFGRYKKVEAELVSPISYDEIKEALTLKNICIPRGLGRSYGDSSLYENIVSSTKLNLLKKFDSGILTCEAGVTLEDIVKTFAPMGWFLSITPGTKFVTIGGAIASDVHGKNHHIVGCFSESVLSIKLMLSNGDIVTCSREENVNLFHATCGGMGLTGFILEATIKLIKISSVNINQKTFKAKNLEELFSLFESEKKSTYSVAWIDCMTTNKSMGRGLLMTGEHATDGVFEIKEKHVLSVPFDLPSFTLNRFTIKVFNEIYYNRIRENLLENSSNLDDFFYPLDGIHNWNRIYGKDGFLQYQFVIPKDAGIKAFKKIFKRIAESNFGSFLAVLKLFGKENANFLSFPMEGYTLALDFKFQRDLLTLLNELDAMVLDYGGRIYLTKDARMDSNVFKKSYSRLDDFKQILSIYGSNFTSHQSKRLGIN